MIRQGRLTLAANQPISHVNDCFYGLHTARTASDKRRLVCSANFDSREAAPDAAVLDARPLRLLQTTKKYPQRVFGGGTFIRWASPAG